MSGIIPEIVMSAKEIKIFHKNLHINSTVLSTLKQLPVNTSFKNSLIMVYYVIRKGRPCDCGALFRLINETAEFSHQKKHPGSDDRDTTVETSEEILRRDAFAEHPLFSFFVVECYFSKEQLNKNDRGEIIGFSTFNEMYSIYKGKSGYMSGMFVSSKHRGNSLAPVLFKTTAKVKSVIY
nr:uncharacterized protein LOC129255493 [Lytechinus pictus]